MPTVTYLRNATPSEAEDAVGRQAESAALMSEDWDALLTAVEQDLAGAAPSHAGPSFYADQTFLELWMARMNDAVGKREIHEVPEDEWSTLVDRVERETLVGQPIWTMAHC